MKSSIALLTGALLALSTSPLVFAQQAPATAATPQQRETRHIHRDTRAIRRHKRDVRQDQRRVNRDVAQGKFKKAQARETDMRRDRRQIRHLQKNRRNLRHKRHVQNHPGERG